MKSILSFIQNYFNFNVLILFFISSYLLILIDSKAYKAQGLEAEYKTAVYMGIIYIVCGVALFGIHKFINS